MDAKVDDGVMTLAGIAASGCDAHRLVEAARAVAGVIDVRDELDLELSERLTPFDH
ncbi:MAG TPA: BON domain-containing protein [Jatrophihabitans sp.]|nr:BON domain-containing protein [Jatrophihabitans sp.]